MEKLEPSRSNRFGFIPKRLEFEDKPELSDLPYNIMFMSLANIDGVDTSGVALYEPALGTYTEDDRTKNLTYFNIYQPQEAQDYIEVWYFKESGWYEGTKFVSAQQYSKSINRDWKSFFIHLTAVGLAKNEACKFSPID